MPASKNLYKTVKEYCRQNYGTDDIATIRKKIKFYTVTILPFGAKPRFIRIFSPERIDSPKKAEYVIKEMSKQGMFRDIRTNFRFTFTEIPFETFVKFDPDYIREKKAV